MADFYSVRRLGYAAVAIAATGTIVHVVASAGEARAPEFIDEWVYCLVISLAAVAVLARAVAVREDRLGWALIGAGLASWALGEFLWTFVVSEMKPQPYPSIADAFYLLLYPLEIAGVVTLVRGRLEGRGAGVLVDGGIAAFGAAAVGAALLGPAISDLAAKDVLQTVVEASYPIFDVMMIGCVIGALAVVGPRRDMLALLAAIALTAAADTAYLSQVTADTYKSGTLLDSVWLLGTTAMGIAAWQLPGKDRRLETRHGMFVPAGAVLDIDRAPLRRSRQPSFRRRGPARSSDAAAGARPANARFPRQRRPARPGPSRLDHRLPHRALEQAPPDRRPRGRLAVGARGRRGLRAGDLRPRRLQGLQRHLRPPRRRRAAAADGRPAAPAVAAQAARTGSAATSSACSPADAGRVDRSSRRRRRRPHRGRRGFRSPPRYGRR